MVEGDLLETKLRALTGGEQLAPGDGALQERDVGSGVEVGDEDGPLERRHLLLQPRDRLDAVEVLATVAVAVDAEQHLRLDLREAVDDDAVARLNAEAPQAGGRAGDLLAELSPTQLFELAQLGRVQHRDVGVA